ncbi:MAG: 4-hydroxythreonine-4-phosphate dehydrogenase PdxA [Mariniblastus sp.]
MNSELPRVAITMGDPAGVGPEICLRLLADENVSKFCHPVVFGDADVLKIVAEKIGLPNTATVVRSGDTANCLESKSPTVFHVGSSQVQVVEPGVVSKQTGQCSFDFIQTAIDAALAQHVDAVATGPINKEAWQMAGIKYPGHTELFADRAATDRFCMMMTAPSFSCSLVTTHVGYHEVPAMLNSERIVEVIQLTHEALKRICDRKPKLTVLGLNPHAGEGGLFGNREEELIISPAIESAKEQGIDIAGPLPPDTAFLPWKREETDGYICMYHDQGLIPFKALNFDTGVNITLGLNPPVGSLIRTSVDHGTALDIAWQGKADVSSLISAVKLASKLST